MSDDFDVLPADVRAILRRERAELAVPEDARARLAERLAMTVPGFGPPHVPAALTGAPPSGAGAFASLPAKVLVALALATGGAAMIKAIDPSAPARARAASVVAREIAPHARVVVSTPDVPVTISPPPVPSSAPVPLAPHSSLPLTPIAALREERRLLDLARDAIVRGDPSGALAPTATHATRFPRGVLAEERDALRVRALAHLGRADEARALLVKMRADHPQSFLLEGAAADVEAIP